MPKIRIKSQVGALINLNKIGIPLRSGEIAGIDIKNEDQQREIDMLVRNKLIVILDQKPIQKQTEPIQEKTEKTEKKKLGRPKKIKPEIKPKNEKQRIKEAEAKTQEMGGRVVIGTGNGNVEVKMRRNATESAIESEVNERTAASIEALKKMEEEEKEENKEFSDGDFIDGPLDLSQENGREATVMKEGKGEKVKMVNSLGKTKEVSDPFIDRKKDDDELADAFIEKGEKKDDKNDPFIEM